MKMKMNDTMYKDRCGQAKSYDELIEELLDSRVPKSEREYAAAWEIRKMKWILKVLEQLLEEAETLHQCYNDSRERDGWDEVAEDPCFADARAIIAQSKKEVSQ